MRQMRYEGGFQGRTNKLVDGCYSFWQGGAFPIIHMVLCQTGEASRCILRIPYLIQYNFIVHMGTLI